jgi:hypothetical protein
MQTAMEACTREMARLQQQQNELDKLSPGDWQRKEEEGDHIDRDYAEQVRVRGNNATHHHKRTIQLRKRQEAYLEFIIARQSGLMDHINSLMASARTDVGLEGNSPVLEAQSHDMSQRVRRAISKMAEESEEDLP